MNANGREHLKGEHLIRVYLRPFAVSRFICCRPHRPIKARVLFGSDSHRSGQNAGRFLAADSSTPFFSRSLHVKRKVFYEAFNSFVDFFWTVDY